MKCTWKDCTAEGEHPELDGTGIPWAHLCSSHHKELKEAIGGVIGPMAPKTFLSVWVKAQGGAKAAADRMAGVTQAAGRLWERLNAARK